MEEASTDLIGNDRVGDPIFHRGVLFEPRSPRPPPSIKGSKFDPERQGRSTGSEVA